jgi:hypothetical protein
MIELLLPEPTVVLHVIRGAVQRCRRQGAPSHASVATHHREPRVLEDPEVLRRRRERHREGACQLADRRVPARELRQHRPPRRIGERVEGAVERPL